MKVFLAGATGVIGIRLVPLLVATSHEMTGMTRTPSKAGPLQELGATPVVCDVFDLQNLSEAVLAARPYLVISELTDLPDDTAHVPARLSATNRIRVEGTRNLLQAADTAGASRFITQSIA